MSGVFLCSRPRCWLSCPMGWLMVIPVFCGEHPKGILFLFIYKKEIWSLGCPRAGGFNKLSFEVLKSYVIGSSHKIGLRLFFSKTCWSLAIREKFGTQFWQQPTSPRKPHSWCFVFGGVLRKLGHHEVSLNIGVALVLISDPLNIKPGFEADCDLSLLPYVPLRLKLLASGWWLPVRWFKKESKETDQLHTATKQNL